MNRREFMKRIAAGGVVTAAGIWMPGEKLISIPSGKIFGNEYSIDSYFRLMNNRTVVYTGPEDKIVSVSQLKEWLLKHAAHALHRDSSELTVSLRPGIRLDKPEHLHSGTIAQDAVTLDGGHVLHADTREYWSSGPMVDGDFFTDKIYVQPDEMPRERIREDDQGRLGWR